MRDFFWFAVLTLAMLSIGDYYSTVKTVRVVARGHAVALPTIVLAESSQK